MNSSRRGAAEKFGGTPELPVVPKRHIGRFIAVFVILILVAMVVLAFARAPIDYATIGQYLFDPLVLRGVVTTVYLTIIAMVIGIVLGVITALMRQSANPILRYVSGFYVWLFRGTPQLVQLLIVFNIALIFPMLGIPGLFEVETNSVMTPLMAAIIALGVNEGSYMSEIVRSGMLAVDQGQTEAAKALGMRGGTLMRYIVLPQALRIIVPPTGNELIAMLKITSLAYVISVSELLNSAYVIYTRNYLIIELLFVASIWYLVLTTVLTIGQRFLERRLARGFGTTRKAPTKSSRAATKGALA